MRWFCVAVMCLVVSSARAAERPNVLFVVFDDLNDWVGCLGGHPQSQTPHIDRLAARGMLFTNAHCNASLCNPSRASALTGTLPSTNGVHGNQQDWRLSPFLKDHPTLPQYFREHGYWTAAGGKIYHANHGGECSALNGGHGGLRGLNHPASWTERFPNHDRQIPKLPVPTGRNFNGLDIWHWDWGPIDVTDSAMEDGQVSDWAVRVLKRLPSKASSGDSRTDVTSTGTQIDTPFFLAVGLYATHGPWYCPPAYFAQHPIEGIALPTLNPPDDLDDVPPIAKPHIRNAYANLHARVIENGLYEEAVQAYLAQISFADAMFGKVLDALDASGAAENTIIVLWSDHGWHLGEKQKWHKGTNWEEGTRVPLIVVAPGVTRPGTVCDEPVSLVDLYPTLVELCGLPPGDRLDGESLVPQLKDPTTPREKPAYTINGGAHQSVRSKRWRYIRYSDGSEELYDHDADPTEYRNLAGDPQYAHIKQGLAAAFPDEIRRVTSEEDARAAEEAGFRPIFNGYDLSSWEGDPQLWRVEDGVLIGETTRDGMLAQNSFLIWRGSQPGDFELRLRFRVFGDNNSGVQYRSHERPDLGPFVVSGYQADIHPLPDLLGMIYEERGRRVLATRGQRVVVTPQGRKMLRGTFDVPGAAGAASGDGRQPFDLTTWRDLAVIARGNHLIHQIDGETVAELWDHDAEHRALKGLIALQLHAGPKMRAEFKDLRIKDLPPRKLLEPKDTPLPPDAVEVH